MTAPAAAPASGPIAPPPPRAAPQPPADAHAFAAVLDSLPGGAVKAGASTPAQAPRPPNEKRLDQPPGHSLLGDGSLLASLPFALQAASMIDEGPHAADHAPSLRPPATKGPEPEGSGASLAASAKTAAALGRLIGERAFHFGASASVSGLTGRALAVDSPFAPAAPSAPLANFAPEANPSGGPAFAAGSPPAEAAPIAPRAGKAATNRMSPVPPAHEAALSGPKPDAAAPPPAERIAISAASRTPAESSGKAPDSRSPDPVASAAQPAAQAGPFGAPLSAPFGAAALFTPDGSTAGAADIAPRASAPGPDPASNAPPVREIDVNLSPGGLEDVSMTMRLAGDKLSVVVRAATSQTLSSIEGARDAIADRLAAIGQPLDSFIIKQTGVKADGTTNGNAASADDSSPQGDWRSAQGAGERAGSDDASLARRGAHRDRSY